LLEYPIRNLPITDRLASARDGHLSVCIRRAYVRRRIHRFD